MGAARGRKAGFVMSHEHRVKIQNSNILNALLEHVEGKREMSATQVSAGLGLLRKALPDLNTVELSGKDGGPIETKDVSPRETIERRIASLSARGGDTQNPGKPH